MFSDPSLNHYRFRCFGVVRAIKGKPCSGTMQCLESLWYKFTIDSRIRDCSLEGLRIAIVSFLNACQVHVALSKAVLLQSTEERVKPRLHTVTGGGGGGGGGGNFFARSSRQEVRSLAKVDKGKIHAQHQHARPHDQTLNP